MASTIDKYCRSGNRLVAVAVVTALMRPFGAGRFGKTPGLSQG
jgi:hypothetical protein